MNVLETVRSVIRRQTAAVAEPEPKEIPAPTSDEAFEADYLKLANELNVNASQLVKQQTAVALSATLSRMGLRVYDRTQVAVFLDSQYGKPVRRSGEYLARWAWRPLMTPTTEEMDSFQWMFATRNGFSKNGLLGYGLKTYSKPVPMPVLLSVKEIRAQHPTARFFVSDEISSAEATPVRDPFLMVVLGEVEVIVERWNEPNYRER